MIVYIILSLLLGIVSGLLFKRSLTKFHGPSSTEVRSKIFIDKNNRDKCYKLKPVVYICPIEKSMKKK